MHRSRADLRMTQTAREPAIVACNFGGVRPSPGLSAEDHSTWRRKTKRFHAISRGWMTRAPALPYNRARHEACVPSHPAQTTVRSRDALVNADLFDSRFC